MREDVGTQSRYLFTALYTDEKGNTKEKGVRNKTTDNLNQTFYRFVLIYLIFQFFSILHPSFSLSHGPTKRCINQSGTYQFQIYTSFVFIITISSFFTPSVLPSRLRLSRRHPGEPSCRLLTRPYYGRHVKSQTLCFTNNPFVYFLTLY